MGTGAVILGKEFSEYGGIEQPEEKDVHRHPWLNYELGTQNIGLIAGLAKAFLIKEQEGLSTARQEGIRERIRRELSKIPDFDILEWDGPHSPGILSWTCVNEQTAEQLRTKAHDISWKTFLLLQNPAKIGIRLSWSSVTSPDLEALFNFLQNIR